MAISHNAPTLPVPSRRSFLTKAGAAATAIAIASGSTVALGEPASSDARLIDLARQYDETSERVSDADAIYGRLCARLREECPPPPSFGRRIEEAAGSCDPRRILEFTKTILEIPGPTLWRTAAAAKVYEARIDEVSERLGLLAAEQGLHDLKGEQSRIEEEIRDIPARTVVGLAVKLRVLDAVFGFSPRGKDEGDFWEHFKGEILRDAERLAGLPQSVASRPNREVRS